MRNKSTMLIIVTLLILIFSFSAVYAANEDVTLEKAEDNICEISLGKDGKLVKKLLSVDNDNKEVTLQIDVTNIKSEEEKITPSEIYLVIDNSASMSANTLSDGTTRKEAIFTAAKKLTHSILADQSSTKIGVVSFSSNSDTAKEGTLEDATLIIKSTNLETNIINAIDSIETTGARTNIDAGLQIAKSNFSQDSDLNKYLILLTDGVPNDVVGGPTITYSGEVTTKTKATLKSIIDSNINIITVMTGWDKKDVQVTTGQMNSEAAGKTYGELAQEVFGTQSNPNYGKFYYVTDENVANTITKNVYADVKQVIKNEITNITIVDYFPNEIIENYDFEIVEKANIGTVTEKIDTQNNSITWTIEKLEAGKTASFKYRLKLKENYNKNILNVVTPTNKKVDVTYTNTEETKQTATSDVTPKIVLKAEIKKEEPKKEETVKKTTTDNTVAKTSIPQTGDNVIIIITSLAVIATITGIIKYKKKR